MAEASRKLEDTVSELVRDMRRVKIDLYGPDDDNKGMVQEFRTEQTVKLTKQDMNHKSSQRMMLAVAAVPVLLKLLEVFHWLPK